MSKCASSIFSAALVAFRWGSKGAAALKQWPLLRSIPIAEKFSGSIGRRPQYAKTSGQWRLTEQQKVQAMDL